MVNNFRGRQPEHEHSHTDNLAQMPMISIPRVESPLEKVMSHFPKNIIEKYNFVLQHVSSSLLDTSNYCSVFKCFGFVSHSKKKTGFAKMMQVLGKVTSK